ncbi:putative membrane associated hydrolase (plasmid) [Gemmatirosa kalamazoonensis]|uniref:Putative membrane associated hydrolase n=1 Tax=Gemmatirosa kalamazoonensis TaxID=861299 RepID=W0RQA0_9BACT|nr:DUF5916 domain-containing protein [Gemmatirosa kalamazoonensis]AHG92520.1 putative membrane associated hydrolase [Gemmatirosa kalamazoonensis]
MPVSRLAIALVVVPSLVGAQATSSVHPTPPPVAAAAHRTSPIALDGRLDEAAWRAATPITGLRQYQPAEGEPAALATEVRVLYDDDALYVGARMSDPLGAAGVRAPLARRDQLLDGSGDNGSFNSLTTDKLAIVLDPYHNHIDEVWFEVNPAGVRGESYSGDGSWDPVWEAAARIDSAGWTAELRIPYSQLRFARGSAPQTWGLQVWRYVDRLNERDMWAYRPRDATGGAAFYGHLTGLAIPERPRGVELMPYVVSRGQFRYAAPGNPYHGGSALGARVGGDVKYLVTSNLTLDATLNPDFGQVEVDPATLNLSAFETFYDEKRPFFVAGRGAFSFSGMSCYFCSNTSSLSVFYSRRIGRPPQLNGWVDDRAAFDDTPGDATILGAAKLTGRTSSGYTVGVLDAVTSRETARYMPLPNGPERRQLVEPLANYFVGRVKKDLRRGATTIGVIATSTARRLEGDTVVVDRLHTHAEAVGLDWNHTWHQRAYGWRGGVVVSNVAGSAASIARVERSSAHYFQRPGREVTGDGLFDASYDTLATALRGYGLYTRLAKQSGRWLWETAQNWRSPGFEVNDLAFLGRADYRWMNANLGQQYTRPTRWYRNIFWTIGGQQELDYDGNRTDLQAQAYYGMELPNYWNLRTFVIHHPTVFDDRLTRGGPTVKRAGYDFLHLQLSTDARRRAVFDLSVEPSRGIDVTSHGLTVQPGMALKPAANVFVQVQPTYNAGDDPAQYVTAVTDPTATAFGGTRYVFAGIHTRTLSLDTRVNWTFRPDVTLQLFAQPFFASGDYRAFREFAAPRTVRTLDYGRDVGTVSRDGATRVYTVDPDGTGPARAFDIADPNFTQRSLRGTAVLRWEYRPGSAAYLVWTQQRFGATADGTLDLPHESSALFRDRPENVFLVKVTYWVGR